MQRIICKQEIRSSTRCRQDRTTGRRVTITNNKSNKFNAMTKKITQPRQQTCVGPILAFCWQHCWANVGKLCWANVILLIGPQLAQHQYANKVNYLPTICQQCQLFANSLPTSSSFKIMLDQCWSNNSMPTMASVCQTCFSCISYYVVRNIYLQNNVYYFGRSIQAVMWRV